ncbi:Uncharacterized protein PECH_007733 [Penicillium ucsense]|uniref:Uncharacterized protein n=1 Tax=Penicillium ucsense TaxID=2839758 RepID=A0A8J8VZI7_9EURO|nr:Uncharacterized protein PECM_007871 [Penicillium ucsense]KAF7734723.1 Uncharacterized protein PECH_007733 [Penicillium ucsense]
MSAYAPQSGVRFIVSHGVFQHAYDICNSTGQAEYHVDVSHWTPGKADMTFHKGADSSHPIIGIAKFQHLSKDAELGLVDPSRPEGMERIPLPCDAFMTVQYAFQVIFPGEHHRRTYTWKRTRSHGFGSQALKLVDETGRVIAVYSAGGGLTSRTGQMDLYVNYGEKFQLIALMSGLALQEKLHRSRKHGAAGVAGAGGSGGLLTAGAAGAGS